MIPGSRIPFTVPPVLTLRAVAALTLSGACCLAATSDASAQSSRTAEPPAAESTELGAAVLDAEHLDASHFYLARSGARSPEVRHPGFVVNLADGKVHCHASVLGMSGKTVTFVWTHQASGAVHAWSKELTTDRYRLSAAKSFHGKVGAWTVELHAGPDGGGPLLGRIRFIVIA